MTIGNTGGFDLEYGVDIVLNDEMGRTTTIDVVTRKGAAANMAMRSPIEGRSGGATQTSFEVQSISNINHVNSYESSWFFNLFFNTGWPPFYGL